MQKLLLPLLNSKFFSPLIIVLTLIITLTAAFTLPSPTANAAEEKSIEVTPQVSPTLKQEKLPETKFTEKAKDIVEKKTQNCQR